MTALERARYSACVMLVLTRLKKVSGCTVGLTPFFLDQCACFLLQLIYHRIELELAARGNCDASGCYAASWHCGALGIDRSTCASAEVDGHFGRAQGMTTTVIPARWRSARPTRESAVCSGAAIRSPVLTNIEADDPVRTTGVVLIVAVGRIPWRFSEAKYDSAYNALI